MAKNQTSGKRYSTKRSEAKQKNKKNRIRRILFSILVLLIVGATIFFLVIRSSGQISIFENAVGSVMTPAQNAATGVAGSVKRFFTNWRNYDTLQEEYDRLSIENEQLKMEIISAEEALLENERLKSLISAKDTYQSLDPIYAKVIAREAGPWFETFALNRGSNHGVATGMAVVNGDGLVGRVYEVGLNYSKVMTIIDPRSRVACLVQRTRDNGIMRGQISDSDSESNCYVYYLPNANNISPGDTVVTSGTDSLYPKGLKIGNVTAVSLDAGSEGTYAVVSPSVDFQRIEEVFILREVIETADDQAKNLPALNTGEEVEYGVTPTPQIDSKATPTPSPTPQNDYWSYPSATPSPEKSYYGQYKVGNIIEDTWVNSDAG